MAVPQNRKSSSKRGMHRSHDHLDHPTLCVESASGQIHRRHHVCPDGFYRGRQVITERKRNKDI